MKAVLRRIKHLCLPGLALALSLCLLFPSALAAAAPGVTGSSNGITVSFSASWYVNKELTIQYGDGTSVRYIIAGRDTLSVLQDGWISVDAVIDSLTPPDNSGNIYGQVTFPASLLKSRDFTVTFDGQTYTAEELGLSSAGQDEQTGGQQTGGEQTGGQQTGGEQTGGQQTGGQQTGGEQTGGEQTGGEQTGGEQTGGEQTGGQTSGGRAGNITVDGQTGDWDKAKLSATPVSNAGNVSGIRVARGPDGTVYLCFEGFAPNEWNQSYANAPSVIFTQNGQNTEAAVGNLIYVYGMNPTVEYRSDARGTTGGPDVYEVAIPAEYFRDENFIISFAGISFPADTIPQLDGTEPEVEPTPEPVYNGIVVDGSFSDWDAVIKHDGGCSSQAHPGCIGQSAMVFDGDRVYFYLREAVPDSAAGAGPQSTGKYAVTTDLGRILLFELNPDGTISGVDGAQANHTGNQWEFSIPASALPPYNETISFGIYLDPPMVTDVANLNGSGGNAGAPAPIVIDGQYGDWDAYPHETIQYATEGTGEIMADSCGALLSDDSTGELYCHVVTSMPEHLDEHGGCFFNGVTIAFNGQRDDLAIHPVIYAIGGDGSIVNVSSTGAVPDGNYTFYIFDRSYDPLYKFGHMDENNVWHSATAADLVENALGVMKVTVNGYQDEIEFSMDLSKAAEFLGVDDKSLQLIEAQFLRLGNQWLAVAGVSSGPWLGVAISASLAAAAAFILRKRKETSR